MPAPSGNVPEASRLSSRLSALGLTLPVPPSPLGAYVESTDTGNLLFLSGTLPVVNRKLAISGRLGENVSVKEGQQAARIASLNALSAAKQHLGDLDRHNDLLDIFDVVRLARHDAWGEPMPAGDVLARAGVTDARTAIARLIDARDVRVDHNEETARILLGPDSTMTIPRAWGERLTDFTFAGPAAEHLMTAHVSLASLTTTAPDVSKEDAACGFVGEVTINDVFYRAQPQASRRYTALAIDNIRRDPIGFLEATLYRVYRVFVVVGSRDKWTNQQFAGGAAVYAAATAASLTFLGLFLAGVVILWRRGSDVLLPLLLILYVPATIAPLLTNMRYSVTVQPLMFVFAAAALQAARDRLRTRTRPRP